jgi:hypothetical protein
MKTKRENRDMEINKKEIRKRTEIEPETEPETEPKVSHPE